MADSGEVGQMTEPVARCLFQLVEPGALVTCVAHEPTEAVMALGLRRMWDVYFAGRAAPWELDQLVEDLEPLTGVLVAAGSR